MIFFSLLTALYGFMCCLIILLVLLQKGKGNMGLGSMGGGNQMLFGSSGGQDIFQKTTWILCALLLVGSFGLSVFKGKYGQNRGSVSYTKNMTKNVQDIDGSSENIE
ncbi:MAG: preprotein translocase subunit SecG [Candidatus Chromulinivorax sp.]